MPDTPRGENPETNQVPPQESAENFSLSKLIECVNELASRDFEYLEALIKDGTIEVGVTEKVRQVADALQEMKTAANKTDTLKKYIPNLVDFISVRSKIDDLIGKTGINPKFGSAIYNLVDAIYTIAPSDVQLSANEAVKK